MSKTPPNRRGIQFEVGAALEARDSLKNWYAANIEKIDYEDEKVLIHYRQWSHRYDEWFDWASPYLRAVERVQLRREGRQEDRVIPGFHVNDKVLASWSDCRFYPAKVLAVNKDASYMVKFYDGVVQTVKGIHVKPFTRERRRKIICNSGEKLIVKKDKKMQENDANGEKAEKDDHIPEEEEDVVSDVDGEEDERKKSNGNGKCLDAENPSVKEENEEGVLEQIGQHNYSKSFMKKGSGLEERDAEVKMEDSLLSDSGVDFNEGIMKRNEMEEADVQVEQKEEEINGHCLPHNRKARRQRIRRKRRLSMARRSSKKSKTDSDKSHNDSKPTNPRIPGKESQSLHLTQPSNGTAVSQALCQSETIKPTAVRKQAFRNPNRFSREPLYRVIRNQPPPVLSINLDHNPYKCSTPGCTKSFRKAKLLHYHMKYYHGDDRMIESDQTTVTDKQNVLNNLDDSKKRCITSHECAQMTVKRRSVAAPIVTTQNYRRWPSQKHKIRENNLDNMHRYFNKEREGFMEIDGVKERDRLKEKQTRDFVRIKLKEKKKIRKTTSDEDSISDWSSDSCGWSEDEMGAELDVIASPLSCSSVASTTGSQETVRCVCHVEEENDFMLQCEECLYWQHGTCMGLLEENVPERYACFICRDSPGQIRGQRQSLRYWYDRDWLSTGHMYGLSFLENYSHQNGKKIAATHQLLGDVQHVVEVLNGLQLKISVLQSQTHPDLKLWCQPWKLNKRSKMKSIVVSETKAVSSLATAAAVQIKEPFSSTFQDYISSEHCYQKPQTPHQLLEPRLVLKARVESLFEDQLQNTARVLKNEQHYNGEIQPSPMKTSSNQLCNHSRVKQGSEVNSKDIGQQCDASADGGGVKGGAQQQWRVNLLEHIETVQEEVTHRMDFIERELDVLENWLDCTGELEPPEPLDRLPELKHSIKQLLIELAKVQQVALTCAT